MSSHRRVYSLDDATLRCSDYESGDVVHEMAQSSTIWGISLSHDEETVAVVFSETLTLVNTATHQTTEITLPYKLTSVAYSHDGMWLALGTIGGRLLLFNATTSSSSASEPKLVLERHNQTRDITSIDFSPTSHRVVSAAVDEQAIVWSVPALDIIWQTNIPPTGTLYTCIFLTGSTVAFSGWDNIIHVWNVEDRRHLIDIAGHTNWVNCLALSPDGSTFASCSWDSSLKIYNATTFEYIRTVACNDIVYRACYAGNDTIIATVYNDHMLAVSISTGEVSRRFSRHHYSHGIAIIRGSK